MQVGVRITRLQANLLPILLHESGDVSRGLIAFRKIAMIIGVILSQLHSSLQLPDGVRQVPRFPQQQP